MNYEGAHVGQEREVSADSGVTYNRIRRYNIDVTHNITQAITRNIIRIYNIDVTHNITQDITRNIIRIYNIDVTHNIIRIYNIEVTHNAAQAQYTTKHRYSTGHESDMLLNTTQT